tara:strand:+ start:274 stop:483 length:210 start_codon:yes stop_codon:yes gene_type:complete
MNINYKQVETLKSFYGVKLRGNETFTELLEIEKKRNNLKGTTICMAKKCDEFLYNNQSTSNPKYCMRCG